MIRPDVRNNTRVMVDRIDWARELWELVRPVAPPPMNGLAPSGLNERFRFYRYDPGQRFAGHMDMGYCRPDASEMSLVTLMIYLNDDFEGGATRFFEHRLQVTPEAGMGLFFVHEQLHEGSEVTRGRKYVLRTDVMYRSASDLSSRGAASGPR